jgi:hypothetical protein
MNRRGWKWVAVAASVALLLIGIHLAWERHRYRLWTPMGTIRMGMTREEVGAVLGPSRHQVLHGGSKKPLVIGEWWESTEGTLTVDYGADGRAARRAAFRPVSEAATTIPRPSLVEHARSWLTGKHEE